jgi:hypothetical protein
VKFYTENFAPGLEGLTTSLIEDIIGDVLGLGHAGSCENFAPSCRGCLKEKEEMGPRGHAAELERAIPVNTVSKDNLVNQAALTVNASC